MTIGSDATLVAFPTARTIRWSPAGADAARVPRPDARFCITHGALARLERDVAAAGHPGLGFLFGAHYHCPELDVDFAVADTVVAWPHPMDAMELALPPIEALREAAATTAAATGRELLGWFQVRGNIGHALSHARTRTHHQLLGAPWQRTLVLTPGPAGPTGCFFHAAPGEAGSPAEFYEVALAPDDGTTRKRSCMTWSDYVAAEPVTLLHESVRRAIAAREDAPWWGTEPVAASESSTAPVAAPTVEVAAPVTRVAYAPPTSDIEPTAARTTAAKVDEARSRPPSIHFPVHVPARVDSTPARRWWRRGGAS